jgi:hypothetical protein
VDDWNFLKGSLDSLSGVLHRHRVGSIKHV